MRQIDAPALEVVDQATGCRDQEVGAACKLAILNRIRRAPVNADDPQPQVLTVLHRLRRYLLRELARRREHEDARRADGVVAGACRARHS